jgi:hypothetical protein
VAVTPRFGATVLTGTETPDFPRDYNQLTGRLEAVGALFAQGTLASRPAAAAANAGMFYRATDQGRSGIGIVYFSTGSAWVIPESYPRTIADVVSPGFSPADGDIVHFHFFAGGILTKDWVLKYIAGRANRKWEVIGGAPMVYNSGFAPIDVNVAASGLLSDIIAIPAPGRYLCQWSTLAQRTTFTSAEPGASIRAWPGSGVTNFYSQNPDDATDWLEGNRTRVRLTGLVDFIATGVGQIDMQFYNRTGNGVARFDQTRVVLTPLELGT